VKKNFNVPVGYNVVSAIAGPYAPAVLALAHIIEGIVKSSPFMDEAWTVISALYRKGPRTICEEGGV
jgi:hypothetical protein